MKKILILLLSLVLFLTSCTSGEQKKVKTANEIEALVLNNRLLLEECVEEMRAFGLERVYVAYEAPKEEKETEEEVLTEEPKPPRLVSFEKESDTRKEIQNETLEKAILDLGLELIFFQTASDSRQCVIFSFTRENATGVQNGFYYSFDALPCSWWGRNGNLKRKGNLYLQISQNGDASYHTVLIQDHFFYFEKEGNLVA